MESRVNLREERKNSIESSLIINSTNTGSSSLAQNLPYDILARIFEQSARIPHQQSWGGLLYGWQSNEDCCRLTTICKNWLLPSQHILFKSISLLSANAAKGFIRTAKSRPDLMIKVQFLVIGLSEDETWPSSSDEEGISLSSNSIGRTQATTSAMMILALRACTGLRHFQVRPLHDSCRDELFSALTETNLETLICSPRLRAPTVEWTGCLFEREDLIRLVLPTLRNFELDAWITPREIIPTGTSSLVSTPEPIYPIIMFSKLVTLRLRFDTSDNHLFALLSAAGQTLENADIYMERLVSIENGTTALNFTLPCIKQLRWTTNPPIQGFANVNLSNVPLFDRLLPNFKVLEKLFISATEVSPSILSLLSPCIKNLQVQAYTYRGPFKFSEEMLTTLSNQSIQFKLKTFTVCDSEEVWNTDDVIAMKSACLARGIIFKFIPDEENDTDSG